MPRKPLIYFMSPYIVLHFLGLYVNGIICYVVFFKINLAFFGSIIILRFTHVVVCIDNFYWFLSLNSIPGTTDKPHVVILFIYVGSMVINSFH